SRRTQAGIARLNHARGLNDDTLGVGWRGRGGERCECERAEGCFGNESHGHLLALLAASRLKEGNAREPGLLQRLKPGSPQSRLMVMTFALAAIATAATAITAATTTEIGTSSATTLAAEALRSPAALAAPGKGRRSTAASAADSPAT